jgi:acyl-CoA reductase-like NAD-dependent aldehyde dehydrogenase
MLNVVTPPTFRTTASLTIGGEAVAGAAAIDVVNPATGEVFASAPDASPDQLDAAVQAAARAFDTWRLDEDVRRSALRECADALLAAADEIAPVLTAEQGKILSESRREFLGGAAWLQYYAEFEQPRVIVQDDKRAFSEAARRPMGPVAAITPWNVPIYIGVAKVAMALRAGNTVVLKPSPYTPLSTLMVGEILSEVLPAGVLNIISGGDALGPLLTTHPLIRKISFTGSIATGKSIAAATAGDLKRLTLELGGNDAAIVLDDADPEFTAEGLFSSAFSNTGQVCVAPKRIYVADALRPALVEALVERARAAKLGNGADPDTDFGPLNNLPQRDRVVELLGDAVASGGKVATGGHVIDGPGYFHELTIVTDVDNGIRIVDEEQFGPALPVISFHSIDDAVERANATEFGLGGSVWSSDPERALPIAKRLEAGTTWVNTHKVLAPQNPFAGSKWSGVGIEGGPWALEANTESAFVYLPR